MCEGEDGGAGNYFYDLINNIFGGAGNLVAGSLIKHKGCPKPKEEIKVCFCVRLCLVITSIEGCLVYGGEPTINLKYGYCSLPGLQLRFNREYEKCA